MKQRAVIALGGNALIKDESRCSIDDQLAAVQEMAGHISDFVQGGHEVIITHGNGPQVGFILRRSELAFEAGELHFVPLKNCVANTQGAIGYQIQESLANEFSRRNIDKTASITRRRKPIRCCRSIPIGIWCTGRARDTGGSSLRRGHCALSKWTPSAPWLTLDS